MYWRMLKYSDRGNLLDIIQQRYRCRDLGDHLPIKDQTILPPLEQNAEYQYFLRIFSGREAYDGPRFNREVLGAFYDDDTLFGAVSFKYFPGVLSPRADDETKLEPFYTTPQTFLATREGATSGWSPEYTFLINAIIEESIQRGIYTCWHVYPKAFSNLRDNPDYVEPVNRTMKTIEVVEANQIPTGPHAEFIQKYICRFPHPYALNVNIRTIKDEYRS